MYWLNKKAIEDFPDRFRARLINSLSGYKSANLVGTSDSRHVPNLAIVSSVVHLGANPPLMGMVTRPMTVRRDTVNNIKTSGQFTINTVSEEIIAQAHQTSAKYEKEISEFSQVDLQVEWLNEFSAPSVKESPLSIGLELREIKPIELNGTEFIIGEIQWIKLRDKVIKSDGFVDIAQLKAACVSGLDCYHVPEDGTRYHYAEPDQQTQTIPSLDAQDISPRVPLENFWVES